MIPDVKRGEKIIADLMQWLQVPGTESTRETPRRVAKMYSELFHGLYEKPPRITTFKGEDGYVAVSDIHFNSVCEHHLLPFMGKCGVVYHSRGRVIGLSKIPRIVEHWSARPNIQENLTMQIAEDIKTRLRPYGVYVVMSARHSCMEIRGIKARGSITNTAVVLGDIDKDEAIRLLQAKNFFDGT
jgi:GTP cyclohydrolase IA